MNVLHYVQASLIVRLFILTKMKKSAIWDQKMESKLQQQQWKTILFWFTRILTTTFQVFWYIYKFGVKGSFKNMWHFIGEGVQSVTLASEDTYFLINFTAQSLQVCHILFEWPQNKIWMVFRLCCICGWRRHVWCGTLFSRGKMPAQTGSNFRTNVLLFPFSDGI